MRDYATKSYRTEQSTGLVWLVTILTSIFLIAGYQAFHRLDHAPVKYKWMDKSGAIQCEVHYDAAGPRVPCKDLSQDELNNAILQWHNPNRPTVKS